MNLGDNMKKIYYILSICLLTITLAAAAVLTANHLERESERHTKTAIQIQTLCEGICKTEYSNAPDFPQAVARLEEAKALLSTLRRDTKALEHTIFSAQAHLESLKENPIYNYDMHELEGLIASTLHGVPGNWSVYFEIPNTEHKIEINNRPMHAASTIKLFNMITVYDELNKGNLELDDALKARMEAMITVSSNPDSNLVVSAIGGGDFFAGAKKVTNLAHALGAVDTQEEHMLFDEPVVTPGKNRVSVRDCGLVLNKLYNKMCITPEYDAQMLDLLKQQTRRFKLPLYLPKETVIAHKTGENSRAEIDVGIIYSPNCDYILCVGVTDFGDAAVRHTIGKVSQVIYNYLNE